MTEVRVWIFYDSIAKLQSNALTQDEAQSAILKIRPFNIARFFIWTQGWQNWQPLKTYLESDQKVFVSTFTISKSNEETIAAVTREVEEHTITRTETVTSFPCETENTNFTNTQTNTAYSKIMLSEESTSGFLKSTQPGLNLQQDFDGDELTFSNIKKPKMDFSEMLIKRMGQRAVRHELKIEILLISPKGKTFRTHSKNISLSGLLAETMIPYDFYDCIFDVVVINSLQTDLRKTRLKLQAQTIIVSGQRSQRLQYANMSSQQKTDLYTLMQDYLSFKANKKNKVA